MRLQAIYQASRTTKPHPVLLHGLAIDRPNQIWTAYTTHIPVRPGFLYLVAVMDCGHPPGGDKLRRVYLETRASIRQDTADSSDSGHFQFGMASLQFLAGIVECFNKQRRILSRFPSA